MPSRSLPAVSGPAAGSHAPAYAALFAVQALFGGMPVFGKIAIAGLGPGGVAAARMAAGMVVFQALRLGMRLPAVPWRDQPMIALCAVFGISANQLLFLHGLERTSALHAALLTTTIPVLTLLVAAALGREALAWRRALGIAVSLVGVVVLVLGRDPSGRASLVGDGMILLNATVYALYLVLSRDLLRRHPPLSVLGWLFTWGFLAALPFLVAPASGGTPEAWGALAFVVLGPTIASYWLNLFALRTLSASVVAMFVYLQPTFATALAWPLLGERPTLRLAVAASLTFLGVWLATRPSRSVTSSTEG